MSFNKERMVAQNASVTELFFAGAVSIPALAGAMTVDKNAPSLHVIIPTASRVITMPAEADVEGKVFWFVNRAAGLFTLTLNNDAAGAIIVVGQNESAMIAVIDGVWRVLMQGASA